MSYQEYTYTNEPWTANLANTYIRDNFDALKNPASGIYDGNEASDLSFTSTSFADIDATNGKFQHTITTNGGDVMVVMRFTYGASAAFQMFFDIAVDGVRLGGTDGLLGMVASSGVAAADGYVQLVHWITGLSAGSHIIKAQARIASGTLTIYRQAGTASADIPALFAVREVS